MGTFSIDKNTGPLLPFCLPSPAVLGRRIESEYNERARADFSLRARETRRSSHITAARTAGNGSCAPKKACMGERERRDIPDPNDLDEDLEWDEEDSSGFP